MQIYICLLYAQFSYFITLISFLFHKAPEDIGPRWDIDQAHWCADRYRDACPQELWHIQDKYYEPRNMSEDCLHLNIFAPNVCRFDIINHICDNLIIV